jgi:hypothetical protein
MKYRATNGSSCLVGGHEAAVAPASVDKRGTVSGWAITADRRHQRMAMVRAVKMTTTRATKKARAKRVRAMRAMTETSQREEGDNGHNNQLGTKATAMARTVVATTARVTTTIARVMATGAKRETATMATTTTMATNGVLDLGGKFVPNLNQEVGVSHAQCSDKTILESLDDSFCNIDVVVVRFDELEADLLGCDVGLDYICCLIVH